MNDQNVNLVENFFKSLKCEVFRKGNELVVKGIPEKIQLVFKVERNVELLFEDLTDSAGLIIKIKDYLRNKPSKTLLKIDFEFPANISEKISLRNCSISKVEKKHENNYFSRFTFLTTFRYKSNIEQVLNEIYVHEGKIVSGNLKDYNVKEGKSEEASTEHLAKDFDVAKEKLHELLDKKIAEVSSELDVDLEKEIERIEEHYSSVLGEFNLNRNRLLERIKETESAGELEKVKKNKELLNTSLSDSHLKRIEDEKKIVIDNEKMKYALDVENKLINTTIIYYPVFKIFLGLNEAGFTKNIEVVFNPLTNELTNFVCDSCKTLLDQINVCHGGHICCSSCLHACSECGKRFCRLCISGICSGCGKVVCKNCARKCEDCGNLFCKNCTRVSSLTGKEKCNACVVYCPVCSKIVEKSNLARDSSGRMVCKSCASLRRAIGVSAIAKPVRKLSAKEIFGE
jgi:hypothetical protein